MTETSREERLLEAFASLTNVLVDDYDVVDLLQRLVETCLTLLDVAEVGLLLEDPATGRLELVASSSEESTTVEAIQLAAYEGPCIETFERGEIVRVPDISAVAEEWAEFRDASAAEGFLSVCGIPMRLRDSTIGALNLFRTELGDLNDQDVRAAQTLAHVATIGVLNERSFRAADAVREQLQLALNSRVVIEQAKGVVAHTHAVGMEEAFERIRGYARSNGLPLAQVARRLVERTLTI
jgi:transcriptional regulator with GAF, ATPase, and Fis domain